MTTIVNIVTHSSDTRALQQWSTCTTTVRTSKCSILKQRRKDLNPKKKLC